MGFTRPPQDRYFEDYVPGSVHEFGAITVDVGGRDGDKNHF
jgi:hypothetical protein